MSIKEHPPRVHEPVLLTSMCDIMQPRVGESYLDLTAGYGGHAQTFLEATGNYTDSVLVDRDTSVASYHQHSVEHGAQLLHLDFASAARQLAEEGRQFDLIIADLGVSSPQLDEAARGFSFAKDGPLDMRMDQRQRTTAADIVNKYSELQLIDLIVQYGEEPRPVARKIAQTIIANRPFDQTGQLATLIKQTIRSPRGSIHPATRTFQSIRIEVNDELGQVKTLLDFIPRLLHKNGRVGIISFHSLEDRLVKHYFAQQQASGYEAELTIVTKKPIRGTKDVHNPRARSAKLRVACKK